MDERGVSDGANLFAPLRSWQGSRWVDTVSTASESTTEFDALRERLMGERSRLKQLLGAVTGSLQIIAEDDVSSTKLRDRLNDVSKALGRIENGTYGQCLGCGVALSASRLESAPTMTH